MRYTARAKARAEVAKEEEEEEEEEDEEVKELTHEQRRLREQQCSAEVCWWPELGRRVVLVHHGKPQMKDVPQGPRDTKEGNEKKRTAVRTKKTKRSVQVGRLTI